MKVTRTIDLDSLFAAIEQLPNPGEYPENEFKVNGVSKEFSQNIPEPVNAHIAEKLVEFVFKKQIKNGTKQWSLKIISY